MKAIHMVAFVLLVVGGLNWLLAAFGWDLATWVDVAWWGTLLKVVYVLVGLSAILEVVNHKKNCKHCAGGSTPSVM